MRRFFLVLLVLCLLATASAAAEPSAQAQNQKQRQKTNHKQDQKQPPKQWVETISPQSVGLGEPFLLRVRSRQPLTGLSATWLTRTARLSGRKIPGGQGGWEAVVLLGSDVGNTALGRHELVLRHGSDGRQGRRGSIVTQRAVIEVLPVERPVERLTLDEAMVTPPREVHARILAERKLTQKLLLGALSRPALVGTDGRLWTLPLLRPVPGEISSIYGIGRILNGQPHAPHRGLDMEAATGEPVLAAADGVVLFAGELYYAGNAVYLDHGQGLVTAYFHLSGIRTQTGLRVARGQLVGLAGDTGRSTRSHLHFGVWALGRPVDPEPLFLYDPLP